MKINLDHYIILCDLFESIPLRTPKRLEIIYGFAKDLIKSKEEYYKTTSNNNMEIIIDMHDESYFRDSPFSLNIDIIARIEQNIPKMKTFVSRQISIVVKSWLQFGIIMQRFLFTMLMVFTQHGPTMANVKFAKCLTTMDSKKRETLGKEYFAKMNAMSCFLTVQLVLQKRYWFGLTTWSVLVVYHLKRLLKSMITAFHRQIN